MNVDVGQVIAGKYELVRLLGKGAMGEVWLAMHNTLGGEVAIKLVEPADDIEAETAAGRFQLEAQIAAKLSRRTRHIVSVSDHGEENGLAYLVMELLEGESLEQRMRKGPLSVAEVAAMVSQVARALSLAHEEGIFHRDIKPANLWLGRDEDGQLLTKLLDFGIARAKKPFRTRSPFATSKDMVLGTPTYMSPEQARGLDSLDHRCDIWALAVVAYEALTRKVPFEGETLEDIFLSICTFKVVPALARKPDLPPAVDVLFSRAFAPKIEDRFATAMELAEAFEQLVTPEELEAVLGVPASVRRLEARRASDPNLAARASDPSHPAVVTPGGRASQPDLSADASSPRVPSADAARGSYPNLEKGPGLDSGGGLGPSVIKRPSSVLVIAAIVAVLLLIGAGVAVMARGGSSTVATQPPEPAPTPSPSASPPTLASAETIELPPTPTPPPIAAPESTDRVGTSKVAVVPKGGQPTAKPGATAARPPASSASSAPAPAKTINKGEVF